MMKLGTVNPVCLLIGGSVDQVICLATFLGCVYKQTVTEFVSCLSCLETDHVMVKL